MHKEQKYNVFKIHGGLEGHTNFDAYDNVLNYVFAKNYVNGYGYPCNSTAREIIACFKIARDTSPYIQDRLLWHFTVSIKGLRRPTVYQELGRMISELFATQYQVVYALDQDPGKHHLHFVVNAFSYRPNVAPLTEDRFEMFVPYIQNIIKTAFPATKLLYLDWKGEKLYV